MKYTQHIVLLTLFISLFFSLNAKQTNPDDEAILIQNMENVERLPKRFRMTSDVLKADNQKVNQYGLTALNASASGQFSEKSLEAILKKTNHPNNFYIVDLRQEYHGFVNGIAISWYAYRDWGNKDKSLREIEENQSKLLQNLVKQKDITIYKIITKTGTGYIAEKQPISIVVHQATNEEQLALSKQLNYIRIPVTDHLKPTHQEIDRFITFVKSLPKNAWVHFHCAGGAGRSTSFLTMFDMMHNAKDVSLDDIFTRQWLLGGYHFNRLPTSTSWKDEYADQRLDFMKLFYQYCVESQDNYKESWSEYINRTQK